MKADIIQLKGSVASAWHPCAHKKLKYGESKTFKKCCYSQDFFLEIV